MTRVSDAGHLLPCESFIFHQSACVVHAAVAYLYREKASTLAKPGLLACLDFFKATGLPIAVASSSPMRLIEAAVFGLGLGEYFTATYSAQHEPYGKPHPGVYITAASGLGVAPTKCLALEDSLNGPPLPPPPEK